MGTFSAQCLSGGPSVSFRDIEYLSRGPSVPFREPSVPFREPSVPFREPSVPFREPSVPFREPLVPFREPSAPFFQGTFSAFQGTFRAFQGTFSAFQETFIAFSGTFRSFRIGQQVAAGPFRVTFSALLEGPSVPFRGISAFLGPSVHDKYLQRYFILVFRDTNQRSNTYIKK
jgi:hypothetical protein